MVIKMVEFVYIFYDMLERNIRGIFTSTSKLIEFFLTNKHNNMICGHLKIYNNNSNTIHATYNDYVTSKGINELNIFMLQLIKKETSKNE